MQNLYQAPASASLDAAPGRASRPLAVWSLALFFAIFGAAWAVGVVRDLVFISDYASDGGPVLPLLFPFALGFAAMVAAVAACAAIFRRRQWGRWVGLIVIAAMVLLNMFGVERGAFPDDAERQGRFLMSVVVTPVLLLWWGYRFGLSDKATRYFAYAPATTGSAPRPADPPLNVTTESAL